MQIYIGSDQAGLEAKNQLRTYLQTKEDLKVVDLGVFAGDTINYLDISREVCEKVLENKDSLGILISDQGLDMSIAANRREGIRAALLLNEQVAEAARKELNANLACFSNALQDKNTMEKCIDIFLATSFVGGKLLPEDGHLDNMDQMLKGRQEANS